MISRPRKLNATNSTVTPLFYYSFSQSYLAVHVRKTISKGSSTGRFLFDMQFTIDRQLLGRSCNSLLPILGQLVVDYDGFTFLR